MIKTILDLKSGTWARISRIDGGLEARRRLESMNLRVGKKVKKVVSEPFRGPVILKIDNTEVAIGRGIASRIFVDIE